MDEKAKQGRVKSLISISPKLYRTLTTELENRYRIHSYDLQVLGIKEEAGIRIILRYGENYSHEKEQVFTEEMLDDEKTLEAFIEEVGEDCKQVLIDDYFKKMAP